MRYRSLDSLRGVCASMVVLMHFRTTGSISSNPVVQHGYLFVDFFFVLSGFVIAASYGDKLRNNFSVLKFMALRLGRVYPLHAAMLAAFLLSHVAIAWLAPNLAHGEQSTDSYSTASFFASLTLTHIFFGNDTTFWNAPSWSIAAEFWTYLIFASLFRSAGRLIVPFSLCAAIAACWCLYEFSPAIYHFINDFHDGALLRCIFGFGLGVVVFHVHRVVRSLGGGGIAWSAAEIAIMLFAILSIGAVGGTVFELFIPVVFCAVVLVFSYETGAVSWLLNTSPLRLLGTLSYSIYMIHFFLLYKVMGLLALAQRSVPSFVVLTVENGKEIVGTSELTGDLASIIFLAFVVGCAAVSYRWIETPAREWSRRAVLGDRASPSIKIAEANAPAL